MRGFNPNQYLVKHWLAKWTKKKRSSDETLSRKHILLLRNTSRITWLNWNLLLIDLDIKGPKTKTKQSNKQTEWWKHKHKTYLCRNTKRNYSTIFKLTRRNSGCVNWKVKHRNAFWKGTLLTQDYYANRYRFLQLKCKEKKKWGKDNFCSNL